MMAILLVSCSKNNNAQHTPQNAGPAEVNVSSNTTKASNVKLGPITTDSSGKSRFSMTIEVSETNTESNKKVSK
jgi:hypothetical protein